MSSDIQTQTDDVQTAGQDIYGIDRDMVDIVDPYDDPAEINRGKDVGGVIYFAGIDPSVDTADVELPTWWTNRISAEEEQRAIRTSLPDVIDVLPTATTTEVAWLNPETGEYEQTHKHNALINPDRIAGIEQRGVAEAISIGEDVSREDAEQFVADMGVDFAKAAFLEGTAADMLEDADGIDLNDREAIMDRALTRAADQALWNVPSDSYTVINPAMFLDPLVDAIEESDLGGIVFGEFELSDGGGSVRADIYFDAAEIDMSHVDGDRDPIMLGLNLGWDHFSGSSAFATGIAMDTSCKNSLRELTDKISVRHTGDVEKRIDFWGDMLDKIGAVTDDLTQMIIEAVRERVDFRDLPMSVKEFFTHLGFPDYLAKHAANHATKRASDPYEPSYWNLHSGATYALTHKARGNADRVAELNRLANDLLMNPAPAVERVSDDYRQAVERQERNRIAASGGDPEEANISDRLANHSGLASVAEWNGDVKALKEEYLEREEALKAKFSNAQEMADAQEAAN